MALDRALLEELKASSGRSEATLSRWATQLNRAHGPMSADEARWVIAHDLGVDLRGHLSPEQLDRVAELRGRGAHWPLDGEPKPETKRSQTSRVTPEQPQRPTPRTQFDSRDLHPRVVKSSRKLLTDGHRTEAVRKAFQTVNNRVKRLAGTSRDGFKLMTYAFGGDSPALPVNSMSTESEQNEQQGVMHLFAGAVLSQRNPTTHEDDWEWDRELPYVLDCMSFASMLHRILDHLDSE